MAWQGSDESLEAAKTQSQTALEDRIGRKQRGEKLNEYPGKIRPLREEIIREIYSSSGERTAVITRNRAGCLVLNTSRVMFIDLDFANQHSPWKLPSLGSLVQSLRSLFKPKALKPDPHTEAGLLEKVIAWQKANPSWSLRVYRTRAGFRLLVAHDVFDPTAEAIRQVMDDLGADRRYQHLCRVQACFRARLSPKPWRIKGGRMTKPPVVFPYSNPAEERQMQRWEQVYQSRIESFAVCRVLANLGANPVHPEVEQILEIHDQYTLNPDKPLA